MPSRKFKYDRVKRLAYQRRPRYRQWLKEKNARFRYEALVRYSQDPPSCACCGETQYEFLTIDHINGGGNTHRRQEKVSGGAAFVAWLRRNNFPPGFQVLCYNCNCARGAHGVCPHQQAKPVAC